MTKTKRATPSAKAGTLFEPFNGGDFKWPDDRTSYSGTLISKQIITVNPARFDGTTGVSHNWGMLMFPSIDVPVFQLYEDTNGVLQDVNATGVAYNSAFFPANRAAVRASPGLLRCTGMAARIVYEGTELNRAGRYITGTARAAATPVVVAATGTRLSAFSALVSTGTFYGPPGGVEQELLHVTSGRVGDGIFEAVWRPSKVPQYMAMPLNDPFPGAVTTAAGVAPAIGSATFFNNGAGLMGMEADQSALVLMIEGDSTTAATANGNPYKLELVWHWEHIPQNPMKTVISLSPSPYDPLALAAILNKLHKMPTGRGTGYGSMDSTQPLDRAQPYRSTQPLRMIEEKSYLQMVRDNPKLTKAAANVARAAYEATKVVARGATPARRQRRIAN